MKIDFMKIRDTFLGYCLVNSVTHADKVKEITGKTPDGLYEIQFIVNGVELPLEETFEDINQQIERMVKEKALELLKEKFSEMEDIMAQITEELKRKAEEKLGIEIQEW